jgi:hypothetical protein
MKVKYKQKIKIKKAKFRRSQIILVNRLLHFGVLDQAILIVKDW